MGFFLGGGERHAPFVEIGFPYRLLKFYHRRSLT
jgi:hypothetical protein